MLSILYVLVAGGIFRAVGTLVLNLPSEHPGVKVRSAFRVGCAEVSPAKRAVDPGNSDSNAFLGLPGAERSARWILDDRHAPRIHNIERWSKNFAAQLLRLGSRRVGVVDRDVNHPVRRNAVRALLGAQGASSGSFSALEFEFCVEIVGSHRIIVRFPAKQRAVKTLSGVLVGSVEFNPAKGTGGVLVDVCHSGTKCTPNRGRGLSTGDEIGATDVSPVQKSRGREGPPGAPLDHRRFFPTQSSIRARALFRFSCELATLKRK